MTVEFSLQMSLKRLAIQAIGTLAEVEKATFEKRVLSFIPELQKVIQPDLYNDVCLRSPNLFNFSLFTLAGSSGCCFL